MSTKSQATVEDLYRIPDNGKAEIVNGEIVLMSPTGDMPGRAGGAIYVSLRGVERRAGGRAYPDNVGFRVELPNRKSFSPDAAFYVGRSEERRVGKECRSRWSPCAQKKKKRIGEAE